jgi:hypothetical protein
MLADMSPLRGSTLLSYLACPSAYALGYILSRLRGLHRNLDRAAGSSRIVRCTVSGNGSAENETITRSPTRTGKRG